MRSVRTISCTIGTMGRRSVLLALAATLLIATVAPASPQATKARPEAPSAVLLRGTFSVRGLPFFGPNAIGALHGEYLLGTRASDAASAVAAAANDPAKYEDRRVSAWYTKERVVLSTGWKASASAGPGAFVLARPEGPVLFLKGEGYSLFLELRAETPETKAFAQALNRKFGVFFRNAASDAELSFPALVEY